ncbi:TolB family protein [Sphaerimonospora cavernae]|uniref:TolB family protein n=1 Tax=Sphaerimonospora cavernae TaxID=1740611 RepID=A0ABV6UD82_9ACTN
MKRTALALAVTAITGLAVLPSAAVATTATTTGSTGTAPKPLAGVAVYWSWDKGHPISRYEPGKGFTKLGNATDAFQFSVSPDGTKLAWITWGGKLHIRTGGKEKVVAKDAAGGFPCATPVWSPDSARVAYLGGDSHTGVSTLTIVKADGTGVRKAGNPRGVCHLAWSADGRRLAGYTGETDGVYIFDLKTGKSVRAKGIRLANHVQSLSPDARKVVVRTLSPTEPGGDGLWPGGFTPTVVDTVTGKRVPIPVKGTKVGAFYLPDGRLVVRVLGRTHNTLVVLDSAGRELQRLAEPAQARNQALLQLVS